MRQYNEPERTTWNEIIKRPSQKCLVTEGRVSSIIDRVRKDGDNALYTLTQEIDNVSLKSLFLEQSVIDMSALQASSQLKEAIEVAYSNIEKFHRAQIREDIEVETIPGIKCMIKSFPLEKIGIYIPGGSAPLFSTVLMLGIPAAIAGCKDIIMFTPPLLNGGIESSIAYAAKRVGIDQIVTVGGGSSNSSHGLWHRDYREKR